MMTFKEQIGLAREMGAKYVKNYWQFPSEAVKQSFERRVAGLEWTEEQQKTAEDTLRKLREATLAVAAAPLEPAAENH